MNDIILYILLGGLGGLAYSLSWSKKFNDFITFESIRHVALGFIIGFLYFFLHSEWNFPNSVMSFVSGWCGVDFLQSIIERIKH